jgi:hypothetical protein
MADMALDEGQSEPPAIAGVEMNVDQPRDPIDELREANPMEVAQLPRSSQARVWARIEEKRMTENTNPGIPRWAVAASGLAVAVVAVAAIQLSSGAPTPSPDPTNPGGGGGGMGMCIQYSIEELRARDFAFDGTVTALNGDQATFAVNTAFWGVEGTSITLTAAVGMTSEQGVALDGGPMLVVGERYLISGDDIYAWACGYSLVYDPAVAAEWAAAAP